MDRRAALVTGASRGIGKGIAKTLASNGFDIILNYRENHSAAKETEKELRNEFGTNVLRIAADVSDAKAVKELYNKSKSVFGFVDTVVNNAGIGRVNLLQDEKADDFDYVIGTNLKGVFNVCKMFVPDMISNRFGRIVNISSVLGLVGGSMEALYSISKAGVNGLTKSLAKELGPSKVTVNAIAPGLIDTQMSELLPQGAIEMVIRDTPLGRIGLTDDIADAVSYLCRKESSFITGEIINISGGFVIT